MSLLPQVVTPMCSWRASVGRTRRVWSLSTTRVRSRSAVWTATSSCLRTDSSGVCVCVACVDFSQQSSCSIRPRRTYTNYIKSILPLRVYESYSTMYLTGNGESYIYMRHTLPYQRAARASANAFPPHLCRGVLRGATGACSGLF